MLDGSTEKSIVSQVRVFGNTSLTLISVYGILSTVIDSRSAQTLRGSDLRQVVERPRSALQTEVVVLFLVVGETMRDLAKTDCVIVRQDIARIALTAFI